MHAALAINAPEAAMKAWHRLRDHAGELATGRPAPPQTESAVPAEAEVLASIEAARKACADCPQ